MRRLPLRLLGAIAPLMIWGVCAVPAAAAEPEPLRIVDLRVEGGEGNWHAEEVFRLDWDQVPGPPIEPGAVVYRLFDPDGEPIGDPANGAPTFAMSWVDGALSPWQLVEGGRAPGPGEVVIDKRSADVGNIAIGDEITLLTQTGPHELTLVGTVRFGSVDSPGGASVSLLDLATSQQLLLGGAHELDAIMVHADPGIDEATLTARIGAALPDGTEALTGSEITDETQQTMRDAMGFFNTFLLVFAAIGLVVACFTIYNTFQIVVTQRTREMALLRSVGATRTQVLWAQLLEALLVGVAASIAGLAAGVGVARALKAMMGAMGFDIPGGGTVFASRTAIVALAVGITVTVVAAVFPSLRASRIPPRCATWPSTCPGSRAGDS
jgi:putative ABC transport system permease protein